ncbi:MAG: ATP12 family chaperone protein [Devosia sp.]
MREFLEDAHDHRDDGYGRAQAHARQTLSKRFYKGTGVVPVEGGFAVTLDGRSTKTSGMKPIVVPVAPLATAMAAEWAAQDEFIEPETMPLVRLVNAAIESGDERVVALREEIVKYAGNDLLLYRADTPQELVTEQERLWDAALVKVAGHFEVSFQPTIGIIHQSQPAVTLAKLADTLRGEGLLVLTALVSITSITGSGLLAIALWRQLLTPDEVWEAAHVDEDYNVRVWGIDAEAMLRRRKRKREFDAAVQVLDYLRA